MLKLNFDWTNIEFQISGLETNVNFLITLARHPSFRSGDVHTGFIPQHFDSLFPPMTICDNVLAQAAVALIKNAENAENVNRQAGGAFVDGKGFRLNHLGVRKFQLKFNDKGEIEKSVNILFFFTL